MSRRTPTAIFLGKSAAIVVQLLALQILLGAGVAILYDVELRGVGMLLVVVACVTLAVTATGVLYGALAFGERGRETLLPLLFLPVVAPVLLGATRATEAILAGTTAEAWPWVRLIALFAAIYVFAGIMFFSHLLED